MRRRKRSSVIDPPQLSSRKVDPRYLSEEYKLGVPYDVRYKVVMVGDSMVGKSSLLRYWRGEYFEPCLMTTIGIDFCGRIYDMESGRLRLDVWDTAGQERYGTMTSVHYRDAKGFIFVYDITNSVSFRHLAQRWLNTVDEHVSDAVPIFVVGNKADLDERRQVSTEEGQRFSDSQGASVFMETSAVNGAGVLELFHTVARVMANSWGLLERLCKEREEDSYACGHTRPTSHSSIRLRARGPSLHNRTCCSAGKGPA